MNPADLIFLTDFKYEGEIIPDDNVKISPILKVIQMEAYNENN